MSGRDELQHELWSMAVAGDNDARNKLYLSVLPLVNRVCTRLSRTYGKAWREEFMQQAFLTHCKAVYTFKPDKGLDYGSYLAYRVEHSSKYVKRLGHRGFSLRKHVVMARAVESLSVVNAKQLHGRHGTEQQVEIVSDTGAKLEISRDFAELLGRIGNDRYRRLIVLRFVEGLTRNRIAKLWQVSPRAIAKMEQSCLEWCQKWGGLSLK